MKRQTDHRVPVTPEEQTILLREINRFFSFPKRSNERIAICNDLIPELTAASSRPWDTTKVRVWFRNNCSSYVEASEVNTVYAHKERAHLVAQLKPIPTELLHPPTLLPPPPPPSPVTAFLRIPQLTAMPGIPPPILPPTLPPVLAPSTLPALPLPVKRAFPKSSFPPPPAPPATLSPKLGVRCPAAPLPTPKPPAPTPPARVDDDDDEIPRIPVVPDDLDTSALDTAKFNLYHCLGDFRTFLRQYGKADDARSRIQQIVEQRFLKVLELLRVTLGVPEPACADHTGIVIRHGLTKEMARQYSKATQTYLAAKTDGDELEHNGEFVLVTKKTKVPASFPPQKRYFYLGNYDPVNGRSAAPIETVECALFVRHELAYVCDNREVHQHQLVYRGAGIPTGFFMPATSMTVDENEDELWIAGDVRVRGFSLGNMQFNDVLWVRNEFVQTSCLTVWNDLVVLGTGNSLYTWQKRANDFAFAEKIEGPRFTEAPLHFALDPSALDWTKGRPPLGLHFSIELPNITAVCAVGEHLAVASLDYPMIHVYGQQGGIVALRLIGHTMGITCLMPGPEGGLFTGSVDKTMKVWNLDAGSTQMSLDRHGGRVSCMSLAGLHPAMFVVSGGADHRVRFWDLHRRCGMFQVIVGDDMYPIAVDFEIPKYRLQIVAEKRGNPDATRAPGLVHSEVQTYSFLLPAPGADPV
jgi:hypothetical protein